MAIKQLGTNANNSLSAVAFSPALATLSDADLATIAQAILDDDGNAHAMIPGSFVRSGLLFVPRRGVLKVLPGDVVAVDTTGGVGWPILVSANAIANGAWHFV